MFTHHPTLVRDLRNARRVLWFSLVLELAVVAFASLSFSPFVYALLVLSASTIGVLFMYLLFLGYARLAKHHHAMPLFFLFVAEFALGIIVAVWDTAEKLVYYRSFDPFADLSSGAILLVGAVLAFAYGVFVMTLPARVYGPYLFRARVANVAKAITMALLVVAMNLGASIPAGPVALALLALGNIVLLFVTYAIDYAIFSRALAHLARAPRPHPAPSPTPRV